MYTHRLIKQLYKDDTHISLLSLPFFYWRSNCFIFRTNGFFISCWYSNEKRKHWHLFYQKNKEKKTVGKCYTICMQRKERSLFMKNDPNSFFLPGWSVFCWVVSRWLKLSTWKQSKRLNFNYFWFWNRLNFLKWYFWLILCQNRLVRANINGSANGEVENGWMTQQNANRQRASIQWDNIL